MERRTWLKGLAAGVVGAVAPAPAAAESSPPATPPDTAQAAAAAPTQRFLDEHMRRTLTSLAEIIVPGAVAAGVVDLIDRVASVDGPARQRQLLNAIGRFDQDAQSAHGARWIDLQASQQTAIMRRASETSGDHFTFLRTTVINAYMATETGMKEFGYAGRHSWSELPGCTHPSPAHE